MGRLQHLSESRNGDVVDCGRPWGLCVTVKGVHVSGRMSVSFARWSTVVPFAAPSLHQLRQGWARPPLLLYRTLASLSSLPCLPGIDVDTLHTTPCQHSQPPPWSFSGRMLPFGMRAVAPCVGPVGPRSYLANPCLVLMMGHQPWYGFQSDLTLVHPNALRP